MGTSGDYCPAPACFVACPEHREPGDAHAGGLPIKFCSSSSSSSSCLFVMVLTSRRASLEGEGCCGQEGEAFAASRRFSKNSSVYILYYNIIWIGFVSEAWGYSSTCTIILSGP